MSLTKIGSIGINTGIKFAGVTTITTLNSATDTLTIGGPVSIAGTLTYEDVTNVDSVGLITARNGVVVGSGITLSKDGDIFATGITTVSGNVKVGTGITLSPDGDGFFTGVVTATTFKGDGSQLSNVTSTTINNNADNRLITGSDTANTLEGESTLTYGGTELLISNASPSVKLNDTDNSGVVDINNVGGAAVVQSTGDTVFETNSAERVRIDSSGDVSIGSATNGGSNRLNVVDSHTDAFVNPTDSILRITNENSSADTNQASISFTCSTTGSGSDSAIVSQAEASGDSRLEFWTDTNNGMSEKMSINHDGYVLKPLNVSFCISSPGQQTYSNDMIISTASANTSQPFHNIGGHWSTSNNEFTAPISGRYMMTLSFTFWFQSSNATDGWDVAVQRDTGSGYSDVAEYYFAGGISSGYEDRCNIEGIWHLNAGDKIRYQTGGYGGSGYFEQKIFTGYLMG